MAEEAKKETAGKALECPECGSWMQHLDVRRGKYVSRCATCGRESPPMDTAEASCEAFFGKAWRGGEP